MENIYHLKRERLISDGKKIQFALDGQDQKLLRTFLGYENGFGLNRATKKKEEASIYVKETILNKTELEKIENNKISDGSLPRIFPLFSGDWFKKGIDFSEEECCATIRSFQSFKRFYMCDYSYKRFKPGTRLFISGPVRITAIIHDRVGFYMMICGREKPVQTSFVEKQSYGI